jgi:hypothetical protein
VRSEDLTKVSKSSSVEISVWFLVVLVIRAIYGDYKRRERRRSFASDLDGAKGGEDESSKVANYTEAVSRC